MMDVIIVSDLQIDHATIDEHSIMDHTSNNAAVAPTYLHVIYYQVFC